MCKYYTVVSDTLAGSFLDVLFLSLAVIQSELMRKLEGKIELQKKIHREICVRDITFLTARSPFYAFLLLFSSNSSPFPNDALAEWLLATYISMSGILRDDVMSNRSKI